MNKIVLFICVLLLTACSYDEYKIPNEVYINQKDNSISVYNKVRINELIEDSNVEIINKNEIVKTDKIGNQTGTATYKYKKRIYKYDINYNVIDKEKPFLINYSSSRTIPVNIENDFCKDISFADNYDREPKCKINGDINFMVPGTYYLKYILTDQSNYITEEILTVNVVESITDDNYDYSVEIINFDVIIISQERLPL